MKKIKPIKIKNKFIGVGHPTFIIAEMSGNHNGDINRAYKIIDAVAEGGADAIKLQTYTPDTITIDSDKDWFKVKANEAWKGKTLYQLYGEAYTPWDWQAKLKDYAEKKGLIFFSTPFDSTSVDFLETLGVDLYKVASFEVPDIPLLEKIGKTKKPVIMSRGMSSVSEIKLAVKTLKKYGCPQVALLHCVSAYPAKAEDMNISTIPDIAKKFGVISGLSDHTLSNEVSLGAVALGALIIEKHVTLKRTDGGPDAAFSLEPDELKEMVRAIRTIEKSIGKPCYEVESGEKENVVFRKSLFIVENIKKGEKFTEKNIHSIRPGYGLAPRFMKSVLGKKAKRDLDRGEPLIRGMF